MKTKYSKVICPYCLCVNKIVDDKEQRDEDCKECKRTFLCLPHFTKEKRPPCANGGDPLDPHSESYHE